MLSVLKRALGIFGRSENFLDVEGEVKYIIDYSLPPFAQASAPSADDDFGELVSDQADSELISLLFSTLFAAMYDRRPSFDDPTVESGWTICVLNRSLRFFCSPIGSKAIFPEQLDALEATVLGALRASFRRSLTLPLYRSWSLSMAVFQDLLGLFRAGSEEVVQRLTIVADTLKHDQTDSGGREDAMLPIIARVWIEPLLAALQSHPPLASATLQRLLDTLASLESKEFLPGSQKFKTLVGAEWALQELEEAALQDVADGHQGSYV